MQSIGLCLSQGACFAENKVAGIKRGTGEHRVVEVGMVRKCGCVKQGYLDVGEEPSRSQSLHISMEPS